MNGFIIIGIILLIAFITLFTYVIIQVVKTRRRVADELSGKDGVFTGPSGEPFWTGTLPETVDDYTEPRYVYENGCESRDFLPQNGRIIGYRISPSLVIHSRVIENLKSSEIFLYQERLGGSLLTIDQEIRDLRSAWNDISYLRIKSGDTPLPEEHFWVSHKGVAVVTHCRKSYFIMNSSGSNTLILKR